jgi:UDP-GlcNAc:undecaprenyl-phosphate GlcNAc-1-phosphate transferase
LTDAARYGLAFSASLAATVILTPLAARVAHRVGLIDHPRGHKMHANPTPVLGGAAVVAGLMLVAALASGASGELLVTLLCAVFLAFLGLVDDMQTVSPFLRLVAEGGSALALWLVGVRAGIFGVPALDLAVTVVWVIAMVNAVNMVDNMDGLAGGVAMMSSLGIALVAAGQGDYLVASFALAVCGASAGFLLFNFPPARIFLGDAGSMSLGFLLAALALKLDLKLEDALTRAVILLLLTAVPLFDLSVVVLARLRRRHPAWLGATDHTSHRLSMRGLSRSRVAAVFIAAQAVCSGVAVLLYVGSIQIAWATAIALVALWIGGLVIVLRLPHPVPDGEAGQMIVLPEVADEPTTS